MKNNHSPDARKRKALLLLPVLVIPFLTMAFWAMGGGKGQAAPAESPVAGLNMNLPPARLKEEEGENKMSFYDAAQRAALQNGRDSTLLQPLKPGGDTFHPSQSDYPFAAPPGSPTPGAYRDPNEEKIYRKIDELNRHLVTSQQPHPKAVPAVPPHGEAGMDKNYLEQLERVMRSQSASGAEPDPELENLKSMMDKILDIQHPERVRERLKSTAGKKVKEAFPVNPDGSQTYSSLLGGGAEKKQPDVFYGTEEGTGEGSDKGTIEAVVHGTQTLLSGSIAKLRLLQDLHVGEYTIPKGSFVFSVTNLNGERAEMTVASIQYGGSILPVDMEVYDLDGLRGLYIPGAMTGEAMKTSADDAVQDIDIGIMDPSLKAQAASAGLSTVKKILGKKTKGVRITVKAGYKVFLKNKKNSFN
ncbi:MAG: hypothetical protein JWP69_1643 [Flaviaesturariibacter sp.]|nr:hypothetical protein [Flaviaesturariibacter sp.]